jgi:hypothetical protein
VLWIGGKDPLKAEGYPVRAADVARLTPLRSGHINMLGRYAFILPEAIAHGALRPHLRQDKV